MPGDRRDRPFALAGDPGAGGPALALAGGAHRRQQRRGAATLDVAGGVLDRRNLHLQRRPAVRSRHRHVDRRRRLRGAVVPPGHARAAAPPDGPEHHRANAGDVDRRAPDRRAGRRPEQLAGTAGLSGAVAGAVGRRPDLLPARHRDDRHGRCAGRAPVRLARLAGSLRPALGQFLRRRPCRRPDRDCRPRVGMVVPGARRTDSPAPVLRPADVGGADRRSGRPSPADARAGADSSRATDHAAPGRNGPSRARPPVPGGVRWRARRPLPGRRPAPRRERQSGRRVSC